MLAIAENLVNLRWLFASGTNVTDFGMIEYTKLTAQRNQGLSVLELSCCRLTDEGLIVLVDDHRALMKSLRTLVLRENRLLTSSSLEKLCMFRSLTALDLTNCKMKYSCAEKILLSLTNLNTFHATLEDFHDEIDNITTLRDNAQLKRDGISIVLNGRSV
uniref:Uncharacterized protein n=2 Tax=Aplanochytrium stocchinoi TaxID=215587 RepID=A0A7S3UY18_9STRA|mmetsp:Transcript_3621/g.4544  ORF Transcript_3621/g.4544 Transcript_3621/m.4544 type:complete len:160 (+) Transcript_3621:93-572(+)